MHEWFIFWILLDPLDSLSISRCLNGRFHRLQLTEHCGFHGNFQCVLAFSMIWLNSLSSGSIKTDASPLSRIVELRFLDRPMLFFLPSVELPLLCRTILLATNGHVWQLLELLQDTSGLACVVLVTSIYFNGFGNLSSFGTWSCNSRFDVMTMNEIPFDWPKFGAGFCVIICFALVETCPNFLQDLHWVPRFLQVGPASKWIFGFHDLFPTSLLCHLRSRTYNFRHFSALSPWHWVFERWFLTRLNFPAPQCLRPKLSKFSPRSVHIRGIFRVKLSYQIGGALTGLLQRSDIFNHWPERNVKKFLHIAFLMVFSHLPGSLEHSADNSSISWKQPSVFHPSRIVTMQQRFFLLFCVPLFPQKHSSRIDEMLEARWFHGRSSRDSPNSNEP